MADIITTITGHSNFAQHAGSGPMTRCFLTLLLACGPALAQRPPVILVDGYHLLCQSENLTSLHDFGQLESQLGAEGVKVVFLGTCTFSGKPAIETMGDALGEMIRGLKVPQIDIVSHSMGGLIVRSYLSGKQTSGRAFNPPLHSLVRKWVSIATPNFGAFIPSPIQPFLPDVQTRELVPGNPFLFDLATWNQNRDDLRGVDAIALVGNAGGIGPLQGSNDGTVAVTSASLSFVAPDERTRVLPCCHGAGDLTSILGLGCDGPALAQIGANNPLSWQIIDSFLSGTDVWKTIGHSPSQDSYLSKFGGVLSQQRDQNDVPTESPVDRPFVSDPPMKGGYTVVITKPGPQIGLAIPSAALLSYLSLAPRLLASIYGTNLYGSAVTLNGRTLPLSYANASQINTLLPEDLSGLASLTISNGTGSQTVNILIEPAAPAIFTRDGSGTGAAAAIREGNDLSLYLTGLGLGQDLVSVFFNGQTIPVTYAGSAPGFKGLDQINVQLPSFLAAGRLTVLAGDRASNSVSIPAP